MRLAISLLLIVLCLPGQFWPHAHGGMCRDQKNGQGSRRPHVHLCGALHEHADHEHAAAPSQRSGPDDLDLVSDAADFSAVTVLINPRADHDHDALYLTDVPADGRRFTGVRPVDSRGLNAVWLFTSAQRQPPLPLATAFDSGGGCGALPRDLGIASLRI